MKKFHVPSSKFDMFPLQSFTPEYCAFLRDGNFLCKTPEPKPNPK